MMRQHLPIPSARAPSTEQAPPQGHDWLVLLSSLLLQLILAWFFGHAYDIPIFMATGYQVATGGNPYAPADLSVVFHNAAFRGITTAGYPPPWPLMLGAIYRLVYATTGNFLAYNAAIKLPLIAANVGLAYLVRLSLLRLGSDETTARRGWLFLLFNPFLLFATAAWGQIDSMVALLSLGALISLDADRPAVSAVLLSLAISFKPTAFPLIFIPFFFYVGRQAWMRILSYYAALALGLLAFCVAPFLIFGWDSSPIQHGWNAHFIVGGGMSPFAALELIQNSYMLPGNWWLLGVLWIPALLLACLGLRGGIDDFKDLLRKGTALVLVFLLTRAWLSEQNVVLPLPLVLILSLSGDVDRRALHALWILPLAFSVVNTAMPQLLFPSMPQAMEAVLNWMDGFRTARLVAKVIVAIPWQVLGWLLVSRFLSHPRNVAVAVAA
jgi:Glycosyltransferase family 87